MMHCAINSNQAVCWQDGEKSPTFTPAFTADWDGTQPVFDKNGNKISGGLTNVVGTIPQFMPFAGWPNK